MFTIQKVVKMIADARSVRPECLVPRLRMSGCTPTEFDEYTETIDLGWVGLEFTCRRSTPLIPLSGFSAHVQK